jgi:hypothetical protein
VGELQGLTRLGFSRGVHTDAKFRGRVLRSRETFAHCPSLRAARPRSSQHERPSFGMAARETCQAALVRSL